VDLAAEKELADILINASRDGLVDAAHDLSDGGLAQALVESCLRRGIGARVWIPDDLQPFVALFSESAGRAIVAVPRSEEVRFTDMCTARGFAHARIGVTDGRGDDAVLDVQGQFSVPLGELRQAWSATLPDALG
jgi:phosphoribosylformylglycinamidine synthase